MVTKEKWKFLHVGTIIVIGLIFVLLLLLSITKSTPETSNSQSSSDIYTSPTLNISFKMPSDLEVNDNGLMIILSNSNGKIEIVRNGNELDNLEAYLNSFDKKRTPLNVLNTTTEKINGYSVIVREETLSNISLTQKAYYFDIPPAVYVISADSKSLYGDLDHIAQSFHYTP